MEYSNFSEIICEIKDLINDGPMKLGSFDVVSIYYTGTAFLIVRNTDINFSSNQIDLNGKATSSSLALTYSISSELIYDQTIKNSIFFELNILLKKCKEIFGKRDKFDKLIKKLAETAEFKDVLESI